MVQNITLSADAVLIEQARDRAQKERKSLNVVFREWLASYVGQTRNARDFARLMRKLRHVTPGRRLTRDDANDR